MKNKITNIGIPLAIILAVIVLVVVAITKYNNEQKDDAVAVTVPVELQAGGNVKGSSVGLIITIGNEKAEGSQWNQAASGAKVAVERFNRNGADLSLITEDDRGTADGARQAVETLADQNVSGIVIASSGPHVQAAVDAAAIRGIPVILPYEQAVGEAWSMQPAADDVKALIHQETADTSRIIRIDQKDFNITNDVEAEKIITVEDSTDTEKLAQDVAKETEDASKNFAVVVNADAYTQAKLMRSFQGSNIKAEVILGSDATSPTFSQRFLKDQPNALLNATTPGYATGDSVALQPDGQGRSMSAYLQMVKILSDSPEATSALGDQPFSDVALYADSRAHDAVVALVRGVEKAESNDPEEVRTALKDMRLSPADGMTGVGYDFNQQQTGEADVTMLSPTTGAGEMRSTASEAEPQIVWFAQP